MLACWTSRRGGSQGFASLGLWVENLQSGSVKHGLWLMDRITLVLKPEPMMMVFLDGSDLHCVRAVPMLYYRGLFLVATSDVLGAS